MRLPGVLYTNPFFCDDRSVAPNNCPCEKVDTDRSRSVDLPHRRTRKREKLSLMKTIGINYASNYQETIERIRNFPTKRKREKTDI